MENPKTNKQATEFERYGKPSVEVVQQGVPMTWEVDPDSSEGMPILFDREHCGGCYRVKDGEVYAIRLGSHSDPNGIGVISRNSSVSCLIPTGSEKRQLIMAFFSVAELHPAMLMDCVYLSGDVPFHLEYIYRSAALESNNENVKRLVLSDNAVRLKGDSVIVGHYGLEGEIPDYCNYTYDFITVQVKVVFDEVHFDTTREDDG